MGCFAAIQFADEAEMVSAGEDIDDYAECDEGGAEPEGQSVGLLRGGGLYDFELLEEESEACDYEAEAHEGEAGANPCEESALGGEVVGESGFWCDVWWGCWSVHALTSWQTGGCEAEDEGGSLGGGGGVGVVLGERYAGEVAVSVRLR